MFVRGLGRHARASLDRSVCSLITTGPYNMAPLMFRMPLFRLETKYKLPGSFLWQPFRLAVSRPSTYLVTGARGHTSMDARRLRGVCWTTLLCDLLGVPLLRTTKKSAGFKQCCHVAGNACPLAFPALLQLGLGEVIAHRKSCYHGTLVWQNPCLQIFADQPLANQGMLGCGVPAWRHDCSAARNSTGSSNGARLEVLGRLGNGSHLRCLARSERLAIQTEVPQVACSGELFGKPEGSIRARKRGREIAAGGRRAHAT